MSTTLDKQILLKARALIADEKDWFGPLPGRLGQRCAWIAVHDAYAEITGTTLRLSSSNSFFNRTFGMNILGIVRKNDNSSHAAVLAMFDEAIAKL